VDEHKICRVRLGDEHEQGFLVDTYSTLDTSNIGVADGLPRLSCVSIVWLGVAGVDSTWVAG
jgi:hypothetical protein